MRAGAASFNHLPPTALTTTTAIHNPTPAHKQISFCIGFFVEGGVVKRGSCSNERFYGAKHLPTRTYTQLVDILQVSFVFVFFWVKRQVESIRHITTHVCFVFCLCVCVR